MKKFKAIPLTRKIYESIVNFTILNPSLTPTDNDNIAAHKLIDGDVRMCLVYNQSNDVPIIAYGEEFTYGNNYSSMYMDLEESWQRDLVSIAMLERL